MTADDLMTAGRFGSLTLLSAKALRIYADRGLLSPSRVDARTGYRYYAPSQVRTGWLIGLLRSAGLSLEEVGQVVTTDPATGLAHLERLAATLQHRTAAAQAVLQRARLHLRGEPDASRVVAALDVDRPVISTLRRMAPEEMATAVPRELARIRAAAADAGLTATGDPFGVFHAPVTADSDGPLEVALPVDGLADVRGDLRSHRLPGGLVARRYAEGPETWFPEILALYDEVHSWITEGGHTPVGPPRETWHNGPDDPEPLRLTISWPYATPPGRRDR
ncbi:MerR family transcriptional regulator [Geodermatophilus sp. DSM 44513]|uniref:MerR family transcriptional regulator n=1 Tax=Geodermatophilus sp. DSM 44513 TaxID=1528104 RepID=UPI00127E9B29|nr:MerR family transcriptional regulator [Geodermatophilus sp. DSM 44513]WNV75933.1 MerR family transcriptional regulator [Geodermatophilus sp. DSM 44513]